MFEFPSLIYCGYLKGQEGRSEGCTRQEAEEDQDLGSFQATQDSFTAKSTKVPQEEHPKEGQVCLITSLDILSHLWNYKNAH